MTDDDRQFIRTWKNVTEVAVKEVHMVTEDVFWRSRGGDREVASGERENAVGGP